MAKIKTAKPARKVTFAALSVAVAKFVINFLKQNALSQPMPVGVTASLTTVIAFVVGYGVPPHSDGDAESATA